MALIQFTCWNVDLPIWQMKVAMWYCWILEVFFFPRVSVSLSLLSASTLLTTSICVPLVSGARGLQSPPLSGFWSFPTSQSRPQGPRRFCCKQSATAGPTVSITACQHHSAKTCSMRCTNLQVNKTLHRTLVLTGDDWIPLMRLVFLRREL